MSNHNNYRYQSNIMPSVIYFIGHNSGSTIVRQKNNNPFYALKPRGLFLLLFINVFALNGNHDSRFALILQQKEVNKKCRRSLKCPKNQKILD